MPHINCKLNLFSYEETSSGWQIEWHFRTRLNLCYLLLLNSIIDFCSIFSYLCHFFVIWSFICLTCFKIPCLIYSDISNKRNSLSQFIILLDGILNKDVWGRKEGTRDWSLSFLEKCLSVAVRQFTELVHFFSVIEITGLICALTMWWESQFWYIRKEAKLLVCTATPFNQIFFWAAGMITL